MAFGEYSTKDCGQLMLTAEKEIITSTQLDESLQKDNSLADGYVVDSVREENKETSSLMNKHVDLDTSFVKDKIGHRRVHTGGNVSYKNIDTSKIMESIKIGIQQFVGGQTDKPDRDLLMMDFMTVESTSFSINAGVNSPALNLEFIFKTYAPVAFWHFRDLFGIKPDTFVSSFCDAGLVELPNPGASGSVFYLTRNDEFITKTVQRKEASFLQKLLPGYYLNLNQNPCTLLPKFFGLYCFKRGPKNVRMVVMNNVLPSSKKIHQKYDLKGSTYNRKASSPERNQISPTFKDLDFISHHPEGIFLEVEVYNALVQTIKRDCRVLESFQIMDYSLLVGVHNLDQAKRESTCEDCNEEEINRAPLGEGLSLQNTENNVDPKGKDKSSECKFERIRILEGLPASQYNGDRLLLFIGIIDILQCYDLKKKLEHAFKSVIHDGDSVSVHNPTFYAKRFQEFMLNKVFKIMPTMKKKNNQKFRQLERNGDALLIS